ncbi:type IV pilin protein, partial [Vibrio parahaemolyticus]
MHRCYHLPKIGGKVKRKLLVMIRISRCNSYKKRLRGMTLIELLIAVTIVGIIAAI